MNFRYFGNVMLCYYHSNTVETYTLRIPTTLIGSADICDIVIKVICLIKQLLTYN